MESIASDIKWIQELWNCVFIAFILPGLMFMDAGSSNTNNIKMSVTQSFLSASIGMCVYCVFGRGLAESASGGGVIGIGMFEIGNEPDLQTLIWCVLLMVAVTVPAPSMQERLYLHSRVILCFVHSVSISIVMHWVMNHDGWLNRLGFQDTLAISVTSLASGSAAFVTTALTGPRSGRFLGETAMYNKKYEGHSFVMKTLGVWIVFLGWFGLTAYQTDRDNIMGTFACALWANSMIAIILSSFISAVFSVLTQMYVMNGFDGSMLLNGMVAGMVSIGAGVGSVYLLPLAAISAISAFVAVAASVELVKRKIDDSGSIVASFMVPSVVGLLLVGFFDTSQGIIYTHNAKLLGIQCLGVVAIVVWEGAITACTIYAIKMVVKKYRLTVEEEEAGCDSLLIGSCALVFDNEGNDGDKQVGVLVYEALKTVGISGLQEVVIDAHNGNGFDEKKLMPDAYKSRDSSTPGRNEDDGSEANMLLLQTVSVLAPSVTEIAAISKTLLSQCHGDGDSLVHRLALLSSTAQMALSNTVDAYDLKYTKKQHIFYNKQNTIQLLTSIFTEIQSISKIPMALEIHPNVPTKVEIDGMRTRAILTSSLLRAISFADSIQLRVLAIKKVLGGTLLIEIVCHRDITTPLRWADASYASSQIIATEMRAILKRTNEESRTVTTKISIPYHTCIVSPAPGMEANLLWADEPNKSE